MDELDDSSGLEFVRVLNRAGISAVILAPALGSLIAAVVWMSVSISKDVDVQVAVGTAFNIASYLVTAGMYFRKGKPQRVISSFAAHG